MPKVLTQEQVEAYHRDGFLFPVRIMDRESAGELRRKLEEVEKAIGGEMQERYRIKAHLPFPWLNELIRNPVMLDAVEDIIGPNILCWGSSFFTKNAHDPRFVSWHQDTTYYGLQPRETLTAWFAFTDSKVESGCMRVIAGSQADGRPPTQWRPSPRTISSPGARRWRTWTSPGRWTWSWRPARSRSTAKP